MKKIKKCFVFLLVYLLMAISVIEITNQPAYIVAEAHSGRTDAYGGHRDNKNKSGLGYYHYHCGGYPAHLHSNGTCTYASGSSSTSSQTKKIKLNKTSATIKEGKTLQLKMKGTSASVTWSSSKKSVATVNAKGKVTAKKKGTATITAKSGGKSYKCKIKVNALTLNKTKTTLQLGKSTTLKLDTNKKVTWSSSDKSVVKVTKKGKITALGIGKAVITAKSGGRKYTCKVTVKAVAVEDFYLDDFYLTLKEGCSEQMSYDIYPQNATYKDITWKVEDPSIAQVTKEGIVTGVSIGETILTAECGGFTETCYITVEENFSEADAINSLSYSCYPTGGGIIVIVKNNYKYAINLTAECRFYDTFASLTARDLADCNMLEAGEECALRLSDFSYGNYENYDLKFSAEYAGHLKSNKENIRYDVKMNQENAQISVVNTGTNSAYTEVAIVFYENGIPVGYDSGYAVENKDILSFAYPYDEDYHTILPDNYRIFVNTSYGYY